jgi:serine/threonine protein kinase
MWSAGVLLYAMTAGHLPFDDENVSNLLQKVVSDEVEYPTSMSRSLVDMLRRLLNKNPDIRITIDRLKEHPWFSQCEYSVLIGFNTRVFYHDGSVDKDILDRMSMFGIDCRDLTQGLIMREYSGLTAIYREFRREKITELMKNLLDDMKTFDKAVSPSLKWASSSPSPESGCFPGWRQEVTTCSTPMQGGFGPGSLFGEPMEIGRSLGTVSRRTITDSGRTGIFVARPQSRAFARRMQREISTNIAQSAQETTLMLPTRRPSFEHP